MLGEKFLDSLDSAKRSIINNPLPYRERYKKKVRGFVVKDFPYLVWYIIKGNNIDVIYVFNISQHPKKWKKLVK